MGAPNRLYDVTTVQSTSKSLFRAPPAKIELGTEEVCLRFHECPHERKRFVCFNVMWVKFLKDPKSSMVSIPKIKGRGSDWKFFESKGRILKNFALPNTVDNLYSRKIEQILEHVCLKLKWEKCILNFFVVENSRKFFTCFETDNAFRSSQNSLNNSFSNSRPPSNIKIHCSTNFIVFYGNKKMCPLRWLSVTKCALFFLSSYSHESIWTKGEVNEVIDKAICRLIWISNI